MHFKVAVRTFHHWLLMQAGEVVTIYQEDSCKMIRAASLVAMCN